MDYKDFIKPGFKAIYVPCIGIYPDYCADEELVTIGKFKPYYTNGMADPTPDEYDETCWVELEYYTESGESQVNLGALLPFIEEKRDIIYCGEIHTLLGHDEGNEYFAIDVNGRTIVVCEDDFEEIKHICDLSFDELKELRNQIIVGSMYLQDYRNDLGISCEEVSDYADGFGEETEWKEELDTPENFANYCMNGSIY